MKKFIRQLFEDDTKQICMGRFSLFLGLILTPFTAIWFMGADGEVSLWEAVVRCSPGLIGLIAYCITRAFEAKEYVTEIVEKITKKNKQ